MSVDDVEDEFARLDEAVPIGPSSETSDDESDDVESRDPEGIEETKRSQDRESASSSRRVDELVAPQVHEANVNLLFATEWLDRPASAYAGVLDALEPDLDVEFDAAGSRWRIDRGEGMGDDYEHGTLKFWKGKIRNPFFEDDDVPFIEWNVPVYDVEDEKRNRRLNLQFKPALPDAEHVETGEPIRSLPDDLPHGIRVECQSSNVDPRLLPEVLCGLASALGLRPDLFDPSRIHEWSTVTGLAFYVRVRRDLVDETVVGPEGLLERLAMFSSRRDGKGEFKWDNREVMGHRTAVALDPRALASIEVDSHRAGKLIKSYLPKNPPEDDDEGDNPLYHPKIEVQYNRSHSPHDLSVRWDEDDVDDTDDSTMALDDLAIELQETLLNALGWGEVSRNPRPDVYVEDDHFSIEALDEVVEERLDLIGDPLELGVERERALVTQAWLDEPPTEADRDVLRTLADGGVYERQEDLSVASERSSSTVSRTLRKFDDLVSRTEGIAVADSVVRERLQELFATLESSIESTARGLDAIADSLDELEEDSALGRWTRRYGATIDSLGDRLRLRLATGNLSRRQLQEVLRSGFEAAKAASGIDETRFLAAIVAYHDRDGDLVDKGERVAVRQGSQMYILGSEPTGMLS